MLAGAESSVSHKIVILRGKDQRESCTFAVHRMATLRLASGWANMRDGSHVPKVFVVLLPHTVCEELPSVSEKRYEYAEIARARSGSISNVI